MLKLRVLDLKSSLETSRVIIQNTLDIQEIQTLMAEYGYSAKVMKEGLALYEDALAKVNKATAAVGAAALCTAAAHRAETEVRAAYQAFSQVAKSLFLREPGHLATLGLKSPMPKSITALATAAKTMFNTTNYTPEMRARLASRSYTDAKLSTQRARITEWDEAREQQQAARGVAKQTRQEQHEAVAKLIDWTSAYIKVARVAMRDQKQLLDQLGIGVRTTKTRAQQEAPQKAAATRRQNKVVTLNPAPAVQKAA